MLISFFIDCEIFKKGLKNIIILYKIIFFYGKFMVINHVEIIFIGEINMLLEIRFLVLTNFYLSLHRIIYLQLI
jgi:hypothetical protein